MTDSKETALLLIDRNFRLKLYEPMADLKIEAKNPQGKQTPFEMLESDEYKFDYAILEYGYTPDYDKVLDLINAEHIIPIIVYDKNKTNETDYNNIISTYKYVLEKAGAVREFAKLIKKVKENELPKKGESKERYQWYYDLGSGTTSTVGLYKDTEENRYVAIKKMSLEGCNEKLRNKMMAEFEHMKLLKCPTIIQSYGTKIENDYLYIYLEYANAGTLEKKMEELKDKRLSFECIRDYTIDLLLALFIMNKNNMIHRDVKSENILITSDNVAKLGDLGISRDIDSCQGSQLYTVCGTPYYISPEIISEIPYGVKTDIWSLGVVVYEMTTGTKPFKGNDIYNTIKKDNYPILPHDTDHRLTFLIDAMLRKDPEMRYSIIQLLSLNFMYDRLLEKLLISRWIDISPEFEELISLKKIPLYDQIIMKTFDQKLMVKLQEAFGVFYNTGFKPYKKSLFSQAINNSKAGEDLQDTFEEDEQLVQKYETPEIFYEKLIELKILLPINQWSFSKSGVYTFSFDHVYSNHIKIDNPEILANREIPELNNLSLLDTTQPKSYLDLLSLTQGILSEGIFIKEMVDMNKKAYELITHESFTRFYLGLSLLQDQNISSLDQSEKIAALLNIYQIMIIHSFLDNNLTNIFATHQTSKTYKFSDMTLSDQEIKHIIFRGNKKPPGSYFRMVYTNDPKNQILSGYDEPRVLLILYENNHKLLEKYHLKFMIFDQYHLERYFEEVCVNFMLNYVVYESEILTLPSFIKPYIDDFGDEVGLLRILGKAYQANKDRPEICRLAIEEGFESCLDIEQIIEEVLSGDVKIIYE
jgi:serine/threonine protein kinase